MKLTDATMNGANVYNLTRACNTLIVGPNASGKTTALENLLLGAGPSPQSPRQSAARWVIGKYPNEMSELFFWDKPDRVLAEQPDDWQWQELDIAVQAHAYDSDVRPFIIAWDNLSTFPNPEKLHQLARTSRRNNTQVIAAVNAGSPPEVISPHTWDFFPVRIVMAPGLIPRMEMRGYLPWYGLNDQRVPDPWEFPKEPGTALVSTSPANKPFVCRIVK
ncbi:hypothetical protein [Microbispora sp. NPDC049125]|uniref:hypothetical protein n=1 Tax=Microbispora sp. NPDC049125 TaxID=3154929 RepID=UPI00346677CC